MTNRISHPGKMQKTDNQSITARTHPPKNYKASRTSFGGLIYAGDFSTGLPRKNIASRIAADLQFDQTCQNNIRIRREAERRKKEEETT